MKNIIQTVLSLIIAMLLALSCGQQQVSFKKDVKPILDAGCLGCHNGSGEGSAKSEYSVADYQSVLKGTKYGAVVVPGDSSSSSLYRLVSHKTSTAIQMPPHHDTSVAQGRGEPLTEDQIEIIKNWIDQGALNN